MKKNLLLILLLSWGYKSYSQQLTKVFDSGIWAGVYIDYEFKKNFNLKVGHDIRFAENFTKVAKVDSDLGLQYTINKNFKLATNVRYSYNLRASGFYSHDLRLNYDLKFKIKLVKNLKLRYRLRFQQVYENLVTLKRYRYEGIESNLRNKLQIDYTIEDHQIYLYSELFREIVQYRRPYFNKIRFVLGSKWENKLGDFDYAIAYERDLGEAHPLNYVFVKTYYTFKIKNNKKRKKKKA